MIEDINSASDEELKNHIIQNWHMLSHREKRIMAFIGINFQDHQKNRKGDKNPPSSNIQNHT